MLDLHPFQKLMEVPFEATAFAGRGPLYNLTMMMRWTDPELDTMVCGGSPSLILSLTDLCSARRCVSGPPSVRKRSALRRARARARTRAGYVPFVARRLELCSSAFC